MSAILIKNATLVNEGEIFVGNVLIENGIIVNVSKSPIANSNATELNAIGLHLLPGCIDDQVHFREPGLTHKGNIYSESKAAVAGGITSFMDMPNTIPNTFTQELLEQKYEIASRTSLANYSFFMGASNNNIEEVLKTNPNNVCGIKVFMGSSTGNLLVDNPVTLNTLFAECKLLIATHCEDEETIKANTAAAREKFGEDVPIQMHPQIRSAEACYKSSSLAVKLAKKHNTRLHILHISTAREIELFDNTLPLSKKRITAEACIHHLWFTDADYETKVTLIKWNPAVKTTFDRDAILKAVIDNKIDIIATDHAPHTKEEKEQSYFKAPSGGPLVQHALVAMIELHKQNKITLEKVVEKMCHSPAICFQIEKRGFIRKGYWADLVLVNLNDSWKVEKNNIQYACGWSPFEGCQFSAKVIHTFVNGNLVYSKGVFEETIKGKRILFERS